MQWGTSQRWIASVILSLTVLSLHCLAHEEPGTRTANVAAELRKPPPNPGARPYRELFLALIRQRYPNLLTDTMEGIPVVTVLFNVYGDVVRSDLTISSQPPAELAASEASFSRFGLAQRDLQYVGASVVQTPANTVLIEFGGTGSREIDRSLVQQYFPQLASGGLPPKEGIWILFDHNGQVVRTGQEHFEPEHLRDLLERRYPGISTSDMTLTPVTGPDGRPLADPHGRPLQLTSVWLASGSPLP
jgi:hypothetical protein